MNPLNKRQLHFWLDINGRRVSYCYIRKNGCSSWKKVFKGLSKCRGEAESYSNMINFMGKYHKIKSIKELRGIEDSIVVIREPAQRLFSGYMNQYVMRLDRQTALHTSVSDVIGKNPEDITFYEFLVRYIRELGDESVDAHFWSQISHMADMTYKHKWLIDEMYENAKNLFGEIVANKFFLKRSNTTHNIPRYRSLCATASSGYMFDVYKREHILPSFESVVSDEMKEIIEDLYEGDYKIYRSLRHDVKQ